MRPALRKCISDEDLSELRRHTVGMQELQEMSRPHFMSGSKKQRRFPRDVRLLLGHRPFWIRGRNVVHRWQALVVRAGDHDVSEIPPLIWRRFIYLSLFSSRNGNNFAITYKSLQLFQLLARGFDRTSMGLISRFFLNAFRQCLAGGELSACLLQCGKISVHILAADRCQLVETDVHTFGSV